MVFLTITRLVCFIGSTVNDWALEVPPPGVGLNTVTLNVPALARSVAGIVAVSLVAETYVVVLFDPAHLTIEVGMNLAPLTVNVKPAGPAIFDDGEIVWIIGTGFPVTVKVLALEVPPPGVGLNTVTLNVPALARSVAGIVAVSLVAETYVVVLFDPAHLTMDVGMNLVPLTVRVNPRLPLTFDVGEIVWIIGTGFPVTVKVLALEVPPPGVGLNTVTLNVPALARS